MQITETTAFTKLAQEIMAPDAPVAEPQVHPSKPNPTKATDLPMWWYKKQIRNIPDEPGLVWPLGEYKNIHGFYCGPGPIRDKSCQKLADGKPLPNPTDDLDCACMDHDLDYCRAGLGWKEAYGFSTTPEAAKADRKFVMKIKQLEKEGNFNWYTHMKARMMMGFFQGRQGLPKTPSKQAIAHQSQPLPYDENVKPCIFCSRSASKRQA